MTPDASEYPERDGTERDIGFIAPADINFDFANPRFLDLGLKTEEDVLRYLTDYVDVDELMQSILSAGWIDFEPLMCSAKATSYLREIAAWRPFVCCAMKRSERS